MTKKLFLVIAILLALATGCHQGQGDRSGPPNVILISLDTVRSDHLSGAGYFRETTPAIDQLAAEGVTFAKASTTISVTLPSHLSLFTSRYPREHGVLHNRARFDGRLPTLAQVLQKKGYATAAVIGAAVIGQGSGLGQGFDSYNDRFASLGYAERFAGSRKTYRRPAAAVVREAMTWLTRSPAGRPFFLFLHFYDAHEPYELPPEYRGRFQSDDRLLAVMGERRQHRQWIEAINQYDAAIRSIDDRLREFWNFLRRQGLYDNTLIVITADHGEGLGEHDYYGHGLHLYEEQMRVPLIIRFPGGQYAGERVEALGSLLDVAPTILALTGGPGLPGARGQNLLLLLEKKKSSLTDAVIGQRRWFPESRPPDLDDEGWAPGEKYSVRGERWKYIYDSTGRWELYDLERDPHELENLAAKRPPELVLLDNRLKKFFQEINPGPLADLRRGGQLEAALKALGYIK